MMIFLKKKKAGKNAGLEKHQTYLSLYLDQRAGSFTTTAE